MIDYQLDYDEGILQVTLHGRLREADFAILGEAVDGYIVEHGALTGILIRVGHFPAYEDLGALLSQLRFIRDAQQHVSRVAAVTDHAALVVLPKIVDQFVSAEVRAFAPADEAAALAWLRSELGGR